MPSPPEFHHHQIFNRVFTNGIAGKFTPAYRRLDRQPNKNTLYVSVFIILTYFFEGVRLLRLRIKKRPGAAGKAPPIPAV